jgi:hypothetical protein
MTRILGLLTGAALTLAALPAAAAEPATLLGVFGNWTAFQAGSGPNMSCFARSEPRAKRPANAKRGKVYLIVSDWPERKVKNEPQIVYGYQAKEAGASLGVGGDKFTFFARTTGKESSSWLLSLSDNPRLIDAMRNGVSAVASGTPVKGAKTVDTYSLEGFGQALEKIHAACQM